MSFKRRVTVATAAPQNIAGTKPLQPPANARVISTGIPSFDDILGGGLQLGTDLLLLNPDPHSMHTTLIQKYFVAQGLLAGHKVHIFGNNLKDLVDSCMWIPGPDGTSDKPSPNIAEDDSMTDEKVKIAWRYERLDKFKTTVSSSPGGQDDFCAALDLSCRIPASVVEESKSQGKLFLHDVKGGTPDPYDSVLSLIGTVLSNTNDDSSQKNAAVRIVLPSFANPLWGDISQEKILRFLHGLRSILRRNPLACAVLSLPSHLSGESSLGQGWTEKLGWLSDACICLECSSADPSMMALLPSHHGFLRIISLPRVQLLVPASDRSSTLRGIAASSVAGGSSGVGENNLAFKCTRKRFVVETFHLDVEGGVGERRTTAGPSSVISDDPHGSVRPKQARVHNQHDDIGVGAAVKVQVSDERNNLDVPQASLTLDTTENQDAKPRTKARRKVGFQTDKPDVYDF